MSLGRAGLIALALGAALPARAEPVDMRDYMIQDVCLDATGAVMPGVAPGDPRCTEHRDIREGERVPYHLAAAGVPLRCDARQTFRDNVPFTRNNRERVVGFVTIDRKPCVSGDPWVTAYLSVRWFDDRYAFIMGMWTRGADGGRYGGGVTPTCDADPASSERYYRNWVLADYRNLANGEVGFKVFEKRGQLLDLSRPGDPCPAAYPNRILALWTRGDFTFTNGQKLNAIISHPYSQADQAGLAPGRSGQMERTYWTREFGQTRWENWKREDWVNKKLGKAAPELAEDYFRAEHCSPPYELKGEVTPGLILGPIEQKDGLFTQLATDKATGESHRWYLAGCQETTVIVPPADPAGDPYPSLEAAGERFLDLWK